MSTAHQEEFKKGVVPLSTEKLDGSNLRILIVHTRWNLPIVNSLLQGVLSTLASHNVKLENITTTSVPGSFELPFACKHIITTEQTQDADADVAGGASSTAGYDACIAIGVLIKGDTMHFEYIADSTSQGLMRVGLDTGVPVIFGVLTCMNDEQAMARAGLTKGGHNHGIDWAQAAIEMGNLRRKSSSL